MPPQTDNDNAIIINTYLKSLFPEPQQFAQWKIDDQSFYYNNSWIMAMKKEKASDSSQLKMKKRMKTKILQIMMEEAVIDREYLFNECCDLIPDSIKSKREYWNNMIKHLPLIKFSIPKVSINHNVFEAFEADQYYILPFLSSDLTKKQHLHYNQKLLYKLINIIIKLICKKFRDEQYAFLLYKNQFNTFAAGSAYLAQSFNLLAMSKLFSASKLKKLFNLNPISEKQRNRVRELESFVIDTQQIHDDSADYIRTNLQRVQKEVDRLERINKTNRWIRRNTL